MKTEIKIIVRGEKLVISIPVDKIQDLLVGSAKPEIVETPVVTPTETLSTTTETPPV